MWVPNCESLRPFPCKKIRHPKNPLIFSPSGPPFDPNQTKFKMLRERSPRLGTAISFLIAVAFAVRANAQNLRIEGSTEFQQATYAAIIGALSNPQVACVGGNPNGTDMSQASSAVIVGTFAGQPVTIQVNWSSSFYGIRDLATGNASISWLSSANIPGGAPQYAEVRGSAIVGYSQIAAGQQ